MEALRRRRCAPGRRHHRRQRPEQHHRSPCGLRDRDGVERSHGEHPDPSTSGTGNADGSGPRRSGETALTGTDADQVTAAALAAYPEATIQRVETDADGVYEAHLTTTDGQRLTVQIDADFAVTGTETDHRGGRHGGPRGGSGETALTGTDAEEVTAAALAAYPEATIQRVETDADGVYEAHLTTTDGQRLTVQIDADFAVTGTETDHHGGRHGGPRGGSGETALTGTDADQVTAAALAAYPEATIQRVETDADGVYEAHLTTTDGQQLTVQIDADFAVTGTETDQGR